VDIVHRLRRQNLILREELEPLSLVGHYDQISARQRQSRMGSRSRQFAAESRHKAQISDTFRTGHILHVENVQSVSAVSQIRLTVSDKRRTVHPALIHEGRNMSRRVIYRSARITVYELLRRPPVSHLYRMSRIGDVDNPVDHPLKAVRFSGKMHISAAVVHKAVHADGMRYAAVPVAEKFRIQRILFQTVDADAHLAFHILQFALIHKGGRSGAGAHGADHQIVGYLQLRRSRSRILLRVYQLKILFELGIFRIGHVADHDAVLCSAEAGAVQVVLSFCCLIQLHLKHSAFAVQVTEGLHFQILDISFVAGAFCIEFFCHK